MHSLHHAWITVTPCLLVQVVQNAAAHFLTGTRNLDHITHILVTLHWLPIDYRIQFEFVLLTLPV